MYLGFCAYGPFRPFLPRKKCEKAPCTPTHIYTHRLFSFSGGLKPCSGEPDFQQSRKMYLGFCVYGPFRPFLPRKECENGAYTHTHIYTHRLFSFSGAWNHALCKPEFGKIDANTRQILHFWKILGTSNHALRKPEFRKIDANTRQKVHFWANAMP